MGGQELDVAAAIAQGRQAELEDLETMIEIAAKALLGNGEYEILTRGGYEARIETGCALTADFAQFTILQNGEQLGLHAARQFTDLIEEKGATIGLLEQATMRLQRTGEGTSHMTKELGLEERLGDTRAIHSHVRAAGTVAGIMDGARQDALARPRFPGEQHSRVDGGSPPAKRAHGLGLLTRAEDSIERIQTIPSCSS